MNTFKSFTFFLLVVVAITLSSCATVKRVRVEKPIDTRSKRIHIQTKKTFHLKEMGLYASNEFDAARLNGFEQVNDSTASVLITPENAPINNSAYYSFKLWSTTAKTFYLQFKYPKKYSHRYIPKIKRGNGNWFAADSLHFTRTDSTATLKIKVDASKVWVSAQESVSSADTRDWYRNLIKGKAYVYEYSAGESVLKRNLPVLDIYKNTATGS